MDAPFDDTHVLNVWNVPMGLHEPKWLNLELGKKSEPSEPGSYWPPETLGKEIVIHGRLLIGPCSCSHQMLSRVLSENEVKELQQKGTQLVTWSFW